jgi:hypothetical protein
LGGRSRAHARKPTRLIWQHHSTRSSSKQRPATQAPRPMDPAGGASPGWGTF